MGRFPLNHIVVELLTEAPGGKLALRSGAEGVFEAALDAMILSGADLKASIDDTLRLLYVVLEDKKSPEPARVLVGLLMARAEVRNAIARDGDLTTRSEEFRRRFEGTASSAKPADEPPPGTKRGRSFAKRFKV